MRFSFSALDGGGFAQKGNVDASSEVEAIRLLAERGLMPMEIKAVEISSSAAAATGGKKLRHTDVVGLIRELSTLLSSFVCLAE